MSELEILINIAAVILILFVMGVQGYMFGNLLMGKLLELYDVYQIRKIPNASMVEFGYCTSFNSCERVAKLSIDSARKWERG